MEKREPWPIDSVFTLVEMKSNCMLAYGLALSLLMLAASARSTCRYPIPDGGEPAPSKPNIVGIINAITPHQVNVKTIDGRTMRLLAPASGVAYSAFGGDEKLSRIRTGVATRIWFERCRAPARGRPRIAYLEIFANDPADTPPADYLTR